MPLVATEPDAALELEDILLELAPKLRAGGLDPSMSEAVHGAAVTLALAPPRPEGEARALEVEGCFDLADLAAAAHANPVRTSLLRASVALNRGLHLSELGRTDDAADALERALLLEPAPTYYAARLQVELADIRRLGQDFDAAEALLDEARSSLESLPEDDPERAGAGLRLELVFSRLSQDLGCADVAWSANQRARELVRGLAESERIPPDLEHAVFLLFSDRAAQAESLVDALLALPEFPPEFAAKALYLRGLARWVAARGAGRDTASARADLVDALARGLPSPESVLCRLRLAEMDLAAGSIDEARAQLAIVRDAPDRNSDTLNAALFAAFEARALRAIEAEREELAAARDAVRAAHTALLENRRRIALREGGVGFLHFGVRSEALGELVALELALEGPEQGARTAFDLLGEAQQLGSLARRMGLSAPSLAQVQASLPEGGLLLAYLAAPQSGWLLAIDARGVEVHAIEGRWTLQAPLERFATLLTRSPAELPAERRSKHAAEVDRMARDLRSRLVPDGVLARVLAARSVTVVSESQFPRLAFEALRLPDGRWMGCAAALDHWPSLPVGVDLVRRARATKPAESRRAVGLAAPTHPGALGVPLRLDASQRKSLESAWRGLELWTGSDASAARLAATDLSNARALIFLVHGVEDPDRALPLGMALSGASGTEGVLWSESVAHAPRVELPLVVLGVCGAGRGPKRLGEDGAAHLGGAWIRRGAHCVVQSSFDLEESSTRRQIVALGQGLARGRSVAEALRDARRELARERPEEPYYHQLLQAFGAGQERVR